MLNKEIRPIHATRMYEVSIKFGKIRFITSIIVAVGVFFVTGRLAYENGVSEGGAFAFAIPAALLTIVFFIPKFPQILWKFVLDRVRELGKAIRGEE